MNTKRILLALTLGSLAVLAMACSKTASSSGEKVIKSTKSGNVTITLTNAAGELKSGTNDLFITFTDAAGKPVEAGAASLVFHMAGMGTMPEMNDKATLTTTETPGKYHAQVEIQMASTWEALINFESAQGKGQASLTIPVK
ncbi:MAG: FixH family protein [Acidobacteria bacterium]|nr:FixH family protein [Acidobacteriota bacterium]